MSGKFNLKSIADKVNKLDSKQDFNLQNIKKEKEVYSKELEAEYLRIKKGREEFNEEYRKLMEEKETKDARSEHLDIESIEFNAELNMIIRNLKDAVNLLLQKLIVSKEENKTLDERNLKEIEDLQKNLLKHIK